MNEGNVIGFGILTAATLMLPALALALQIKVSGFFNLAFGDQVAVGAFVTLFFHNLLGMPIIIAALISLPLVGLLGVLIHRIVYQPLQERKAGALTLLVASVGVALILRNLILLFWGPNPRQLDVPLEKSITVGPFLWTQSQMVAIGIAVAAMFLTWLVMNRSDMGRAVKAVADNVELAKARGIDTQNIERLVWFFSSALGGLGGILIAVMGTASPDMGSFILLLLFVSLITGGIANPYRAAMGALVIGFTLELTTYAGYPQYKLAVAYSLMFLILLVRPQGLFSRSKLR